MFVCLYVWTSHRIILQADQRHPMSTIIPLFLSLSLSLSLSLICVLINKFCIFPGSSPELWDSDDQWTCWRSVSQTILSRWILWVGSIFNSSYNKLNYLYFALSPQIQNKIFQPSFLSTYLNINSQLRTHTKILVLWCYHGNGRITQFNVELQNSSRALL